MVLVGTVTGAVLRGHHYRNINILPIVAKRNRAELLSEFRLFLKETPLVRRYARYAVASSGKRFKIEELPDRYKAFSNLLGSFAEEAKRLGNEVYLCTIEMTFDAAATVNLHANIVYRPTCVVGSRKWSAWLEGCRDYFGAPFFHDRGKLKNSQSVIRYVCKPLALLNLSSKQTRFVAEVLHGKQLVRPVGDFAKWRKALRTSKSKVCVDYSSGEIIRAPRERQPNAVTANRWPQSATDGRKVGDASYENAAGMTQRGRSGSVEENRILCTTQPLARASLIAERFVVIRNYTPTPATERGRLGLERLEQERVHYVRILAQNNIGLDVIKTASSILDLSTLISKSVVEQFDKLAEPIRERLRQRLKIESRNILQVDLRYQIEHKLKQIMPKERHPWSAAFANLRSLYSAACERHLAWLQRTDTKSHVHPKDGFIPY